MPRISEFFAIVIYMYWMYWLDTQKHKTPHFHARYGGHEAVYDLSGQRLEGDLGRRADRLSADWCGEKEAELRHAWECAIEGKEIPWVSPLQ